MMADSAALGILVIAGFALAWRRDGHRGASVLLSAAALIGIAAGEPFARPALGVWILLRLLDSKDEKSASRPQAHLFMAIALVSPWEGGLRTAFVLGAALMAAWIPSPPDGWGGFFGRIAPCVMISVFLPHSQAWGAWGMALAAALCLAQGTLSFFAAAGMASSLAGPPELTLLVLASGWVLAPGPYRTLVSGLLMGSALLAGAGEFPQSLPWLLGAWGWGVEAARVQRGKLPAGGWALFLALVAGAWSVHRLWIPLGEALWNWALPACLGLAILGPISASWTFPGLPSWRPSFPMMRRPKLSFAPRVAAASWTSISENLAARRGGVPPFMVGLCYIALFLAAACL